MLKVLGFKNEYPEGKPAQEWVHFTSSDALTDTGQATHSTWENIKRIMPPANIENDDGGLKMAAMRSTWAQIEPHYLAWKEGNEIPDTGTPLGAWPAINQSQAEKLKAVGISTVEAVANANDAMLSRPPVPNFRELKKQAAMFLEGRDKSALEAEIAKLREQQEAMLEMLAEQEADKPKRGRPRKDQTETDTAPEQEADSEAA